MLGILAWLGFGAASAAQSISEETENRLKREQAEKEGKLWYTDRRGREYETKTGRQVIFKYTDKGTIMCDMKLRPIMNITEHERWERAKKDREKVYTCGKYKWYKIIMPESGAPVNYMICEDGVHRPFVLHKHWFEESCLEKRTILKMLNDPNKTSGDPVNILGEKIILTEEESKNDCWWEAYNWKQHPYYLK